MLPPCRAAIHSALLLLLFVVGVPAWPDSSAAIDNHAALQITDCAADWSGAPLLPCDSRNGVKRVEIFSSSEPFISISSVVLQLLTKLEIAAWLEPGCVSTHAGGTRAPPSLDSLS